MIEDLEENALAELKRADHLIYVTLKYTRTADVVNNTIKRLIRAFDFTILQALECLKVEPHEISRVRAKQLLSKIPKLKSHIDFYLLLRKIAQAPYTGEEEYRKNITLVSKHARVDIKTLERYFQKTRDFVTLIDEFVKTKKPKRKARKKVKKKKRKKAKKKKKKR